MTTNNEIVQLTAKRAELTTRLENGAMLIEDERGKGVDVAAWELHWIDLLRQYEKTCDALEAALQKTKVY